MEEKYIGLIVISAVAILIGLGFWGQIGGNIATLTEVQTSAANQSFVAANNGTAKELGLCGQEVVTITVFNGTTNQVPASNYTISYANGADGYLSTFITSNNAAYNGVTWKITCTYKPDGYINDGAGRGIAKLIAIFAALLIVVAALPDTRNIFLGK